MNSEVEEHVAVRVAMLERKQRRTAQWQIVLWIIVVLQAVTIIYLIVPLNSAVKYPLRLQAGGFEVVDQNGTVRAVLTASSWQTMLSMSDANGNTKILLREN